MNIEGCELKQCNNQKCPSTSFKIWKPLIDPTHLPTHIYICASCGEKQ